MKKSILTLTLVLATSLTVSAQSPNQLQVSAEEAKVVHRLFQKIFTPSCATLPQLAICDFNLQNEILVFNANTTDQATLSVTMLPSVATKIAAQDLSERYNFDHNTALQSSSILEAWVKRLQSHGNETSLTELEGVYTAAVGISYKEVIQMSEAEDHKKLDEVSAHLAKKFNTSSREAKLFLESILANEPAR